MIKYYSKISFGISISSIMEIIFYLLIKIENNQIFINRILDSIGLFHDIVVYDIDI